MSRVPSQTSSVPQIILRSGEHIEVEDIYQSDFVELVSHGPVSGPTEPTGWAKSDRSGLQSTSVD